MIPRRLAYPVLFALILQMGGIARADVHSSDIDRLLERHGGERCTRIVGALSGVRASVDDIDGVCHGLACIDDPASEDPTHGVCGVGVTPDDCGGDREPLDDGRCSASIIGDDAVESFIPERYLLTGQVLVFSDTASPWFRGPDVFAGGLFQLGLGTSRRTITADGERRWSDPPLFFLHLGVHGTGGDGPTLGHDIGVGIKTTLGPLSRIVVTALGQATADSWLLEGARYRVGPAAHIEFVHNLALKGGVMLDTRDGSPVFFVGAEYLSTLFDDLLPTKEDPARENAQ